MDKVTANINELENYKQMIIKYYKSQISRFNDLKKTLDKSVWEDDIRIKITEELNESLSNIATSISTISDGIHCAIIDNFIKQAKEYLATKTRYPK